MAHARTVPEGKIRVLSSNGFGLTSAKSAERLCYRGLAIRVSASTIRLIEDIADHRYRPPANSDETAIPYAMASATGMATREAMHNLPMAGNIDLALYT